MGELGAVVIQPSLDGGDAQAKALSAWTTIGKRTGASKAAYEPDEFYCRATDLRGHGEQISFKVPPEVYAQVMEFVHDENFPAYRSPADVFRDAIIHLFAKRREQILSLEFREKMDRLQRDVAFDNEVAAMKYNSRQWQEKETELRSTLIELEKVDAWEQVDTVLHRIDTWAEGIAEPYATKAGQLVESWRAKIPTNARAGARSFTPSPMD